MANEKQVWDMTLREAGRLLGEYLLRYFGIVTTFAVAVVVPKIEKASSNSFLLVEAVTSVSPVSWGTIVGAALLVLLFGEVRTVRLQEDEPERDETIAFKAIGGAISHIVEIRGQASPSPDHCFATVLRYIEKVVKAALTEMDPGRAPSESIVIGANLMVHDVEHSELRLLYFGTALAGREKITLKTDGDPLRPGAPAACVKEEVVYIHNTMAPEYRNFFDAQKDYRSIISIPVEGSSDEIIAVVNVDSNIKDHFGSIEVIRTRILPKIEPLIGLIRLERRRLPGMN